jgi:hypothetical protein
MSENTQGTWLKVDLHIHSHALLGSSKDGAVLAILRQAEESALDIIGLVDHNSARGYEQLRLETGRLTVLKEAGRLSPEQETLLAEYERLLARLLLLPGFEITTQEGVGLLALFPPETPAERLYALLLNLGIPMERLRDGAADIRAQADVSMATALIGQAGGIVIAQHAEAALCLNLAADGTLPPEVSALEVSILPDAVPPIPRPAVWFSAAGCLRGRPGGAHSWKIGERYTEALLEAASFAALRSLLLQGERERLRFPERERLRAYVEQLHQQGPERVILYEAAADPLQLYRDVAALANSGGGILVIGLTEDEVPGVAHPEVWSTTLTRSVREQVDPQPRLNLELLRYGEKEIIRAEVHAEAAPPYVTREGIVYLRRDSETRPATRQELLELVAAGVPNGAASAGGFDLPQAGVAIVGAYLRDGVWFYDVRDLRVTSGVTRQRAKGLWAYAIERQEALRQGRADISHVLWKGDHGVWRAYRSGDRRVFDLLHRDPGGRIDHIFYGVSEWGLTPHWREVVETIRPPLEEGGPLEMEGNGEGEPREGRPSRPTSVQSLRRPGIAGPPEKATPEPAAAVPPPAESVVPEDTVAEAGPAEEAAVEPAAPVEVAAAPETLAIEVTPEPVPPREEVPVRPSPDAWGGRLPRWRGPAAVERVYWEGNNLFFDLAMRQGDGQVRYYRHVHRNQLTGAEGWADLVRVLLPNTGTEIVRCTAGGDEFLYQFRDPLSGRVDPRVRRKSDFPDDSPCAYAIPTYHQDTPLDENRARWWGNIGYLRVDAQHVDLVYRDEEGRDHIYYAAERALLEGEWKEMLQVWHEE